MAAISQARFTIPLKKASGRLYDVMPLLILLLSFGIFAFNAFLNKQLIVAVCSAALAVLVCYWLYMAFNKKAIPNLVFIALFIGAGYWFYQMGIGIVIGCLLLFIAFLKIRVNKLPVVIAEDTGISIKIMLAEHYDWNELANVLIKDSLLTIDCKNNRLVQKETEPDINPSYEAEFNEFCRLKLKG